MSGLVRNVYKYPLDFGMTELKLPVGAEIIHIGEQRGTICLWVLIDPLCQNMITHRFAVAGTGHPLPKDEELEHLGTFQMPPFVWHAFKILPK